MEELHKKLEYLKFMINKLKNNFSEIYFYEKEIQKVELQIKELLKEMNINKSISKYNSLF